MRRLLLGLCLLAALAACGGAPSSAFNAAGYYVRGNTVYYLNAFPGAAEVIKGADPASFKAIDETYATDKTAVYRDGAVLADADPATFKLLDEPGYSQDSDHVFLGDSVLTEDVAHFTFIDGGLAKDSAHVYWSDGRVLSEDPEHFKVLDTGSNGYFFTVDSSTVYVNGNPVKDADPSSFEAFQGGPYSHDDNHVYYFTDVVPEVDATSFQTMAGPYARDDAHAYWMGKVIPGADPAGFTVLNADFECTTDGHRAFYRDLQVKGFDPGTIPAGAHVNSCSEDSVSYQ